MESNPPRPHALITYEAWKTLKSILSGQPICLDGQHLDIASVVAVAKYGHKPHLNLLPAILKGLNDSVELLHSHLEEGFCIYGVNTGYGGSAETRTTNHAALQLAVLQHTQSAIVTSADRGEQAALPLQDLQSHAMPFSWVKASMIVRVNQILRGHSAVRAEVIEALNALITNDITPIVPLRGSISASGDLMPLSFIAGAIQGCPDIMVRLNNENGYKMLPANEALVMAGIEPVVLGPKEGLGLINGTAASAAVASLALYEANQLIVLSQFLTVLASEALSGNIEWLEPFIADIRPHVGQIEASANMRKLVSHSTLVTRRDLFKTGLCQDRYATRSSQQWIGPQLEDIVLAHQQLSTELNSTSDNPVVDVRMESIYSGANFQAASVTSAMEKTRLSLQMIAKMLFGQCTEMINPTLSNGLPPNLSADDPSLSFTMKGIDVNMAAYMSELAYISNPVSTHVQSAEQHNQAINSLAFISARYTMQAVDLVSLMSACFIYVGCQALDLRVLHKEFLESFEPIMQEITSDLLGDFKRTKALDSVEITLWEHVSTMWYEAASLDAHERVKKVISTSIPIITSWQPWDYGNRGSSSEPHLHITDLETWRMKMSAAMNEHYVSFRTEFIKNPITAHYLGSGSKKIYSFVRKDLGVPLHQGLVEHPTPGNTSLGSRPKKTIGSWVGIIYESIRDGRLYDKILETLGDDPNSYKW